MENLLRYVVIPLTMTLAGVYVAYRDIGKHSDYNIDELWIGISLTLGIATLAYMLPLWRFELFSVTGSTAFHDEFIYKIILCIVWCSLKQPIMVLGMGMMLGIQMRFKRNYREYTLVSKMLFYTSLFVLGIFSQSIFFLVNGLDVVIEIYLQVRKISLVIFLILLPLFLLSTYLVRKSIVSNQKE